MAKINAVASVVLAAVIIGVGVVYDYTHNPVCVLPMRNCREGARNCIPPCPGPDVHWLRIAAVAVVVGAITYAFLAASARARAQNAP